MLPHHPPQPLHTHPQNNKHPLTPPSVLNPQVRLYDVLFKSESPDALGDEWLGDLNPDSLQVVRGALIPPYLADTAQVRVCL